MKRTGNRRAQIVAQHVEQIVRRTSPFDLQQPLDAAIAVDQLTVFGDQEAWRHESIEQAIVKCQQLRVDAGGQRGAMRVRLRRRSAAGERKSEIPRQCDVSALAIELGMLVDRVEFVEQSSG